LIELFGPFERGSSGEPGMANTSRRCSDTNLAEINVPDLWVASTTSTPRERTEIMRFRHGKCRAWG
jgi:hypothetical protein